MDWYRQEFDIPQTASTQQTLHLLASEQLIIAQYVEALLPEQEVIQGARRVTLRMFPHMALRELMANMLIHQDFSITGTGPMICIFDGRIEFTNPGSSLVDVARLLNDPPHSRNEKMAAICR